MDYLKSLGVLGAILYVAYIMLRRARTDKIIQNLKRKDRTEELKEIARLTKEIEDAKINYANSRSEYDAITGEGADSKLLDDES